MYGERKAFAYVTGAMALCLALAACGRNVSAPERPAEARAQRIVSLDYCADQYVLKLVDKDRVLAVSPDAAREFSYMKEAAVGVPTVKPSAEDVLVLKPDLVVRSYGGGPNATAFFERAGVPVLNVGWAATIDDAKIGSIVSVIEHMAAGLGEPERGAALVADFKARLSRIGEQSSGQTALYMTPSGVTTGPGSLVHEMLVKAGLENFERAPGWRSLPLERLVYESPDLVAPAFFYAATNHPHAWSAARHPVARKQMRERIVVPIRGALTACGAWFAMDAIEALAHGAREAKE